VYSEYSNVARYGMRVTLHTFESDNGLGI
jgi:hypothetical protein